MNVTIFPTGTGGAESAVRYLLSDKDHEGKKRSAMPEILFGDPTSFADIANATDRKHKYTSGVIAFRDGAESASITDEQITEVIKTFRSTFMPGLKVDENFTDFWVAHRDKGNLELHFLVANTELSSGQQLNIHPPGEKNIDFFNTFSSVMNDTLGFAQVVPDPLKIALQDFEAKSPNGKKDKKAKNTLARDLKDKILKGEIKDRDQLIKYVESNVGDITRIGEDYISVMFPGAKKAKRLRGALFRADSDYAELVKEHHKSKIPKFLNPRESQTQKKKLFDHIKARTAFNQRRYLAPKPGAKRDNRNKKKPAGPFPTPNMSVKDRADTMNRMKQIREAAPDREIAMNMEKHLQQLKKDSKPQQLAAVSPKAANLPTLQKRNEEGSGGSSSLSMGGPALGGLEAQIGSLSMQFHTLMIQLAGARGRRATQIQSQMAAIQQKLVALNIELQRRKFQNNTKDKDPTKKT